MNKVSVNTTQGGLYNVVTTPGKTTFSTTNITNADCYVTTSTTLSKADSYTNEITMRWGDVSAGLQLAHH